MLKKIKEVVLESNNRGGRAFDLFIQLLILLSLISFSIETLPDLNENILNYLRLFEIVSISIFTVEYILRIILHSKRFKYIFSFFGVIDLLAIIPFYVSSGIDLRSIRLFRLLKLFRMLKLLKYNSTIDRVGYAFNSIKKELVVFATATIFLIYVAAVGIYFFENPAQPEKFKSIFHSIWWSVTTLTTVGYGDMYPITVGGKIFTAFIVFIGMGMVAIPAGLLASAFSKTLKK